MKPFKLIKELFPVTITESDESKVVLLIENAINVLAREGSNNIICTVNREKDILTRTMIDYME